jgi:hypothetical protein
MNEDRYRRESSMPERRHKVTLTGQTEDGWRVTRSHTHHGSSDDLSALLVEAAGQIASMPVGKGKLRSFRVEVKEAR